MTVYAIERGKPTRSVRQRASIAVMGGKIVRSRTLPMPVAAIGQLQVMCSFSYKLAYKRYVSSQDRPGTECSSPQKSEVSVT